MYVQSEVLACNGDKICVRRCSTEEVNHHLDALASLALRRTLIKKVAVASVLGEQKQNSCSTTEMGP